ncbi:MAG TPA: cyclase family protein [Actinomycetota bacterium]|nr:cyclase family protein [Actinomycetota bacterium]
MATTVRRVIDLSILLDENTQTYPGDPEPKLSRAARLVPDGFNLLALHIGSQSGTHVDAPYHFIEEGPRLQECDLSLFTGPGVIVDATGHRDRQPITWEDIRPYEDRLRPGVIVLLSTGWSDRHLGTDRYYDHPFLDAEACGRLVDVGVRTVGIDALNVDQTTLPGAGEPAFPCHVRFLGAGGIFAENLRNLGAVDFEDPFFSLLPIRLGGDADGAPCRAVALQLG